MIKKGTIIVRTYPTAPKTNGRPWLFKGFMAEIIEDCVDGGLVSHYYSSLSEGSYRLATTVEIGHFKHGVTNINEITDTMYKGQIEGFPREIVDKMLENQVAQGKPKDITVFEKEKDAGIRGFTWHETVEGTNFWDKVIYYEDFEHFFKRYPKKNIKKCPKKDILYGTFVENITSEQNSSLQKFAFSIGYEWCSSRKNLIVVNKAISFNGKLKKMYTSINRKECTKINILDIFSSYEYKKFIGKSTKTFPENWVVRGDRPLSSPNMDSSHWFHHIWVKGHIGFFEESLYSKNDLFSSVPTNYVEVTKEELIAHYGESSVRQAPKFKVGDEVIVVSGGYFYSDTSGTLKTLQCFKTEASGVLSHRTTISRAEYSEKTDMWFYKTPCSGNLISEGGLHKVTSGDRPNSVVKILYCREKNENNFEYALNYYEIGNVYISRLDGQERVIKDLPRFAKGVDIRHPKLLIYVGDDVIFDGLSWSELKSIKSGNVLSFLQKEKEKPLDLSVRRFKRITI